MNCSECRTCGQTIFWQKSRAGKAYPTDSDDRRDFHKSPGSPPPAPAPKPSPPKEEAKPPARLEDRLQWLESEVRAMLIRLDSLDGGR